MNENIFYLDKDNESVKVRILLNSWDEVEMSHTHEIKTYKDDEVIRTKRVKCLGDNCPACRYGYPINTRMYIPLYNETTKKVQLWERTHYFYFTSGLQHIFKHNPDIPHSIYKITRHGDKGNIQTKYEIDFVEKSDHIAVCDYVPVPEEIFYQTLTAEEIDKLIKE